MMLRPGHWLGRGSLLVEGFSLGQSLTCDVRVESDDSGLNVTGELARADSSAAHLSIRIVQNEVGTYTIRVQSGGEVFHGTAKLDSVPNLGLLWNDSETVYVSFALFPVRDGHGCRGFLRDGATTYTWEMAFSLKQDVIKGDNVVSLKRRR